MKRLLPLAACILLAGCSGLPTAREMGDMALLRTMGIDAAQSGVAVTGSTGPRAKGLQGEEEPALILSADRESLSGACLAMQGQSDSYVFFGYVDQLLIGEALAERGIQPALDFFARDAELGLGAQMWLVRGAAAWEAVSSGGGQGVDSRLETIQNDSKMGIANLTRTAGEVYADLLELGSAFAPALSPAGDGSAVLSEQGYGIFKGDVLAGFLEGEAAKGLELLAGGPSADILEIELSGNRAAVKITSAATKSGLEFQGGAPCVLSVQCRAAAKLSEYEKPLTAQERRELQAVLEDRERKRVEEALAQLRAWGADCTGLGAKAAMLHPAQWHRLGEGWPEWFSKIPMEVRVQVDIQE